MLSTLAVNPVISLVHSHDVVPALARICTGYEGRCVLALRGGTAGAVTMRGKLWTAGVGEHGGSALGGLFFFFLFYSFWLTKVD